jgi:hypothetical protein
MVEIASPPDGIAKNSKTFPDILQCGPRRMISTGFDSKAPEVYFAQNWQE